MNFAPMLTNTGESLIYVSLLLIGMHALFNFKIEKLMLGKNPGRVAPERIYSAGSNSKNSVGNMSVALNRTLRIIRQQTAKLRVSNKLKPDPMLGGHEPFVDFGRLNAEMPPRASRDDH